MKKFANGLGVFLLLIVGLTISIIISAGILQLLNNFKSISAGIFSIAFSFLFLQYIEKYWSSINRHSENPERDRLSIRLTSLLLGVLLFFLIITANPVILTYIVLGIVSTIACYKLTQYIETKWHSINHPFALKFVSWAFGSLVFTFSVIATLFSVLLYRSPDYANSEIINYTLPYFKVIALLIGPFLIVLRKHLALKIKER